MNNWHKWLVFAVCVVPAVASGASLESLFDKGARWHLYVDDWDGEMIVQDRSVTTDSNGLTVVSATFQWKGQSGKLELREYTRDPRRAVIFGLRLPDGLTVEAEGNIGRDTDAYMAGVTRYAGKDITHYGAWYARQMAAGSGRSKTAGGGVSTDVSPGTVRQQGLQPGGFVTNSDVAVVTGTCKIEGAVGGMTQYVSGVWLQPQSGTGSGIEIAAGSNGAFSAAVPAGSYRFGVVPRGKIELTGEGLDQVVNCVSGKTLRISARVNRISEG